MVTAVKTSNLTQLQSLGKVWLSYKILNSKQLETRHTVSTGHALPFIPLLEVLQIIVRNANDGTEVLPRDVKVILSSLTTRIMTS
jgi:hypothetical protein